VIYNVPPQAGATNPTAQYHVTLNASSQVLDVVLTRSSGIKAFDDAVERGIRGCNPFPKHPSGNLQFDIGYSMY
jgi:colicin import membrane protein